MEYSSVYLTARNESEAREIGLTLVREKLVACINYFPVNSIFRWQGNIDESAEFALIAKTRLSLVEKVIERIKQLHSYEVPCIVSWIIDRGNQEYLDWIAESTEID
jgi:periplasmic divalent cation tolerance protein